MRPDVLHIGGYRYAVEDARGLIAGDGEHRRRSGRILLDLLPPEASPDCQREILVHEILHAIRANAGLSYRVGTEEEVRAARDAEERFITSVEWGLVEVLRANPALVAYLCGRE